MTYIWTSYYNEPSNKAFCRASFYSRKSGDSFRSRQCTRKPIIWRVIDGKKYGFCKQHDPEAIKERDNARIEQWKRERDSLNREYDRQGQIKSAMDACKAVIQKIADGHENPRMLAVEMLRLFPE